MGDRKLVSVDDATDVGGIIGMGGWKMQYSCWCCSKASCVTKMEPQRWHVNMACGETCEGRSTGGWAMGDVTAVAA